MDPHTKIELSPRLKFDAPRPAARPARLRRDFAESDGRRGAGEGRQNHRARLAPARGLAARGNRGAPRRAKTRPQSREARRFTSRSNRAARTAARRLARKPSSPPASNAWSSARRIRIRNMPGRAFKILRRAGIEVTEVGFRDRRMIRWPQAELQALPRMRAPERSVQSLDCPPHAVRHRESRDDAGRQNRHGQRRIEMDHRRKGPRARHEIAPGAAMRFSSASIRFWRTIRA